MTEQPTAQDPWTRRTDLPDDRDALERVERDLLAAMQAAGYDETSMFAVRLAMQEALNNAFMHGNREKPAEPVTLELRVDPRQVSVEVADRGPGFDPASVPDPRAEENLEIPAGRGILLMRGFMSEVEYFPPGNRVRMTYRRPADR